jgi:hypothetical protein
MARWFCVCAGLALVLAARPCSADLPEGELARLRAELARLRQENAALKKQLDDLVQLRGDFRGTLKERSATVYVPPQLIGAGTSLYRRDTWLVVEFKNKSDSPPLSFEGTEAHQQALAWKGKQVVVSGWVKTVPGNPFARQVLMPPSGSGFDVPPPPLQGLPPNRSVLVVESVKPVKSVRKE